ncbi:MAG: hypothetical protein R2731_05710 [Nocardioides sp.]
MTSAQADRIIELLEKRPPHRVVTGERAASMSNALETVAILAVALGVLMALGQAFVLSGAGFGAVALAIGHTLLLTAAVWGVLAAGTVVTAYVANRSD